jgi:hypothetical protein
MSTDVGGLLGLQGNPMMGIATVQNSYYNNHAGNPSVCFGRSSGGTIDCTAIADNEPYFYDSSNPPMVGQWDFTTIWQENVNDYPTLRGFN